LLLVTIFQGIGKMASLETQFRNILKHHGFEIASLEIELNSKQRRNLPALMSSWDNFPQCMNVYPATLSKKDMSYLKG
jgi:hypothetical protein